MARLIKSGKNAGVIVLSQADLKNQDDPEVIARVLDLADQQQAERRAQEAAYNELLDELGSPQAVAAYLRG